MTESVLIVEDDETNLRLLEEICVEEGFTPIPTRLGGPAVALCQGAKPALVLLDVALPDVPGFTVLRALKEDASLRQIPVILVTGVSEDDARQRGLELGAEDYVAKPFRVFEIRQRMRNALRLRTAEEAARAAMARAAIADPVDPLTRAGTPQQLVTSLRYEFNRAQRYGHALSCVVVRLGAGTSPEHRADAAALDGLLVELAACVRGGLRTVDQLYRSDQAEFTLLLPETGEEGAGSVLGRLATHLRDGTLWRGSAAARASLLLGSATFPATGARSPDALRAAAHDRLRPV